MKLTAKQVEGVSALGKRYSIRTAVVRILRATVLGNPTWDWATILVAMRLAGYSFSEALLAIIEVMRDERAVRMETALCDEDVCAVIDEAVVLANENEGKIYVDDEDVEKLADDIIDRLGGFVLVGKVLSVIDFDAAQIIEFASRHVKTGREATQIREALIGAGYL